ncbi:MAG: TetR/AcrR family transcriptional regulator [Paludibacteraceae bacterium]|nr:TetR/AcrR family transcriptional regulator [Paludibacteraceae bacterium]
MGTTKTKDILVDAARKLFATQGVENTTMNDIALASHKGRRTLYTYFKNKDEIFFSVIETELDLVANRLSEIAQSQESPEKKLINYIYTRMEAIKEVVIRNGNLNADFFLDIRMVARVRRKLDKKERIILTSIFQNGMDKGIFNVKDAAYSAKMFHLALCGYEVAFIQSNSFKDLLIEKRREVINFIFNGLIQR